MTLKIWCTLLVVTAATKHDPVGDQIIIFKKEHPDPIGVLTTSAGAPVELKESRVTLNSNLFNNEFFMDSLTHFIRERIPDRVVHAKAAGAFGYFEVTHNFTDICKAKLFSRVGKRTPVVARFSLANLEVGGSDSSREARGFAVRFYTEDGNYDILGFNTPMFVYKDPLLFEDFARAEKKNPVTNVLDANTRWDFLTINPESLFINMLIFGDRGIPDGYRHMPGFPIHTFQVVNKNGDSHFIRYHILPDAGIKNLGSDEAKKIAGFDPDYATRDLYRAIGKGEYPSWTISVQVLTLNDVKNAGFDVFDVTKVLPVKTYPLRPVGRLVLNRNPRNYFAEIEQLAFSPVNLVPGILGAPDKLFEARRLAYRSAQSYRLGVNFNNIKVNCPLHSDVFTYNRNGRPPVHSNGKDSPSYFPNTYNGPIPYVDKNKVELIQIYQDPPDNFDQARELYSNEMTKDERSRLIENILVTLVSAARNLQERAVKLYTMIHPDLGYRIADGLLSNSSRYIELQQYAFQ